MNRENQSLKQILNNIWSSKKNKAFLNLAHKRDKVMSVRNIFLLKTKQEMDHFSERKASEWFLLGTI